MIWSGKQWTEVVKKVAVGTKPVFRCRTSEPGFEFIGTENHCVFQIGELKEVKDAYEIDPCVAYDVWDILPLSAQTLNFISAAQRLYRRVTICSQDFLGDHPVWDIEVAADEHSYWTGGVLVSDRTGLGVGGD
jgi:hypothetical protein